MRLSHPFAAQVPALTLDDVLYVSAKTTHTARRPATEKVADDFRTMLRRTFYGDTLPLDARGDPPDDVPSTTRPDDLAPDAHLYFAAKARLKATIAKIGPDTFQAELKRFRNMQTKMLAACGKKDGVRKQRFPGSLTARNAKECIYADQGCGYRCIDAWLDEREARLAKRRQNGRSARAPADDDDDAR